jgi:hypothetical protein
MKNWIYSIAFVLAVSFSAAQAGELDAIQGSAPQGLIVRADSQGHREIFKAEVKNAVQDQDAAARATSEFVKAENKIQDLKPAGELDRVTSHEAWYYWYNTNYYYGYYYYGYNYYYRPCYSWYYGGYNYYYYYRY